jgi:hypothetical protein
MQLLVADMLLHRDTLLVCDVSRFPDRLAVYGDQGIQGATGWAGSGRAREMRTPERLALLDLDRDRQDSSPKGRDLSRSSSGRRQIDPAPFSRSHPGRSQTSLAATMTCGRLTANVCRSPAARASHDATEREGHARAGPGALRCSGRLAFVICATTISNPAI